MPNYGVAQAGSPGGSNLTELKPGDFFYFFNTESPVPPQASIALAMGYAPGGADAEILFTISFSAAPTDSLVIQASNVDVDSQYQTVYTSTNKQLDSYADLGLFAYYRVKVVTWTGGGTLTVIVKR